MKYENIHSKMMKISNSDIKNSIKNQGKPLIFII